MHSREALSRPPASARLTISQAHTCALLSWTGAPLAFIYVSRPEATYSGSGAVQLLACMTSVYMVRSACMHVHGICTKRHSLNRLRPTQQPGKATEALLRQLQCSLDSTELV